MQSIANTTSTTPTDELERSILLFFVQQKRRSVRPEELFDMFRRYKPYLVMKAVVNLCEQDYLIILNDAMIEINNYPLLIQYFMRFKRIATAYLLYFLIVQNRTKIRTRSKAVFTYDMFFAPRMIESTHIVEVITFVLNKRNKKLFHAKDELLERGILIKESNRHYIFNYEKIDPMLLDFLTG